LENLTAIVKLYRGDKGYFAKVLEKRLRLALEELKDYTGLVKDEIKQVQKIAANIKGLPNKIEFEDAQDTKAFKAGISSSGDLAEELDRILHNLVTSIDNQLEDLAAWEVLLKDKQNAHNALHNQWLMLHNLYHELQPQVKHIAQLYKQWLTGWEELEKDYDVQRDKEVLELKVKTSLRIAVDIHDNNKVAWRQMKYLSDECGWLLKKFVDGEYTNVPGLCKLVTIEEVAAKDYSLSPGRYVGVDASADVDQDWEEKLQTIHIEIDILNAEAILLAKAVSDNYKSLSL
jgi:type I restriction enzyme M protein